MLKELSDLAQLLNVLLLPIAVGIVKLVRSFTELQVKFVAHVEADEARLTALESFKKDQDRRAYDRRNSQC